MLREHQRIHLHHRRRDTLPQQQGALPAGGENAGPVLPDPGDRPGAQLLPGQQHRLHRHGICGGHHPEAVRGRPGRQAQRGGDHGHPPPHSAGAGHGAQGGTDPPGHQPGQHHAAARRRGEAAGLRRGAGRGKRLLRLHRGHPEAGLCPHRAVSEAGEPGAVDGCIRYERHHLLLRHRRGAAGFPRPAAGI